jgi:hypothetical protein
MHLVCGNIIDDVFILIYLLFFLMSFAVMLSSQLTSILYLLYTFFILT